MLRPLKHPRGLIFDFDGTLVDTMPIHWRAWQAVRARHGFHFTEDRFYALGGVPSRDILKMIKHEQGHGYDPLAVAKEKEVEYLALIDHVAPIRNIVRIAQAHYGRLPMGVASGGTRRVVERVLAHLRIRHLFVAVVTSDDVTNQKPAPDIFLEAARRIAVPPQRCRAYEDTDLGLRAIRAARMEAVDVRDLIPRGW